MISRPIIFSAPMIRAKKAGLKTMTRRMADSPLSKALLAAAEAGNPFPRLWVREAFRLETNFDEMPPGILAGTNYTEMPVWHEADVGAPIAGAKSPWGHPWGRLRPSIHMPQWASRITLDVLAVRAEKLQAITEEDAIAEGCPSDAVHDPVAWFANLWELLNARRAPWGSNPDVCAITFSVRMEAIGPAPTVQQKPPGKAKAAA